MQSIGLRDRKRVWKDRRELVKQNGSSKRKNGTWCSEVMLIVGNANIKPSQNRKTQKYISVYFVCTSMYPCMYVYRVCLVSMEVSHHVGAGN